MKTEIKFNKLFVLDPVVRSRNSKKYRNQTPDLEEKIRSIYKNWPKYWWGAANAWLVFVGPSPGNSKAKPINWKTERYPTIGTPHPHFINRVDSTRFWPRLRDGYQTCERKSNTNPINYFI
jgi:hypothetical protein